MPIFYWFDNIITYFLYQGVDNTVKTMTLEINFDGKEGNARLYKFVIDPANYTLQANPNN